MVNDLDFFAPLIYVVEFDVDCDGIDDGLDWWIGNGCVIEDVEIEPLFDQTGLRLERRRERGAKPLNPLLPDLPTRESGSHWEPLSLSARGRSTLETRESVRSFRGGAVAPRTRSAGGLG